MKLKKSNDTTGLPWRLSSKESACDAEDTRDPGSIPKSGRSPGEGHGNSLQYSCLENPMDRGAWATVHRVAESDTTEATEHACMHNDTATPLGLQVSASSSEHPRVEEPNTAFGGRWHGILRDSLRPLPPPPIKKGSS